FANDVLKAGSIESAMAGGIESLTNAPYFIPKARGGLGMGHGEINDHMMSDWIEVAYVNKAMGCFALVTADEYGIGREHMDTFALGSLSK
ncbi:acetyl-CoA C-acyltransferase, partial [Pseudoalteromonas sp. S1612]